ncbi:uncharacterized protein LOC142922648 isoform X3 [Petromyzon marinus]|uniref:uncharacterized protein LOC142922648 isoform X3 n=1 Tax=Petromyzon marinus TaxID=7757 RepID=UPI003F70A8D9
MVFTGYGNEDELKLADLLPPAAESAARAGGESDAAASCDADASSRAVKESAPSADDYEMPGRPKGGHGARKKGHKQKQSVPPWAYPSPPLSHPPPFPGFPPYSDDSDIWDDAALIKAYDKAVTSFKTALKNGTATCESPQDLRGDKVREQAGEDTETAQEEQRVALRQALGNHTRGRLTTLRVLPTSVGSDGATLASARRPLLCSSPAGDLLLSFPIGLLLS